jgi:hypothetical protein
VAVNAQPVGAVGVAGMRLWFFPFAAAVPSGLGTPDGRAVAQPRAGLRLPSLRRGRARATALPRTPAVQMEAESCFVFWMV